MGTPGRPVLLDYQLADFLECARNRTDSLKLVYQFDSDGFLDDRQMASRFNIQ